MASYYYLISSLPMLRTQGEPPMDYAAFLAMCRSAVSAGVYRTLEELTVDSDKGPLLSEWAGFYRALSRELTYQRNVKLGRPCAVPSDRDAGIVQTVTAAVNAENPLEGERLLLHGIVDEVVTEETAERGRTVCFRGRGYAARLLDNESPPVSYQGVTLREILRRHVTPYGIRCRDCAETKAEGEFTVAAGSSQWKVREDFCRVYGGFVPRFDRYGELLAVPERDGGERLVIDDETELLSLRRREDHYGVLSEVLVLDKSAGSQYIVRNEDFLRRGGSRRQVVCTPGRSTWQAMRYTGEYQIARSREAEVELELTLPGIREAEPGETVELRRTGLGLSGTYRLSEVEILGSESQGALTVLRLRERM